MLNGMDRTLPERGAGQGNREGEAGGVSRVREPGQARFNILGQTPSPGLSPPKLIGFFLKQFIFFYFLGDIRFSFLFLEANPIRSLPISSLPE